MKHPRCKICGHCHALGTAHILSDAPAYSILDKALEQDQTKPNTEVRTSRKAAVSASRKNLRLPASDRNGSVTTGPTKSLDEVPASNSANMGQSKHPPKLTPEETLAKIRANRNARQKRWRDKQKSKV